MAAPAMSEEPVLVAFGSNLDPMVHLVQGLRRLHQTLGVRAVSRVYQTAALPSLDHPKNGEAQPPFLNGAVWIKGGLSPSDLKRHLRQIETLQKRVRTTDRYAARTLDLDIALLGPRVITSEDLRVPDPDILHRAFLAIPLAELAPHLRHPTEGVSLSQVAARWKTRTTGMVWHEQATRLLQAIPETEIA